ncbi:elongation factor G [Pseudomonas sp. ZM23]|uniref:Elongation factor G n=1 Tax=Pseudomonas triclosanedens TaxID=2961893 RepID=A0ABY6ZXQ4_9PSED|nr:elongation factor G [Pseudomonas triclosanedens]MCP8462349.1 elongation factor G [Pseudomonas triclosanedens]MCP8467987.1 elongation factor G [Pseudomonas triclosanedens]MCP8474746.1 elongation factor G [Pseudomonas triclosanedens]WAI49546.1 elongation factor G [Pseudomonas triclosanedens]
MSSYSVEHIRTVALVGHGDSGKTLLAEALLQHSGAIASMGSLERGDTLCDSDPMEREYHHSLAAALVHLEHEGTRINLIDTPGYPDFIGHALPALGAVETALVVVNAQNGIELTTRRMMGWAADRGLCRMLVVNRIDAERVDLPVLLADLREAFGKEVLPLNLPAEGGTRVVDCFFAPDGDSDFSSVAEAHQALVDQVVEVDEELMAHYLEEGEVAPEALHAPFERALREGHLIPLCFVSARTGAGVTELLDVLARLAPSPAEGNPPLFVRTDDSGAVHDFRSSPEPEAHVLAHVFKVVIDPFVGRLAVFRVHQGTVRREMQLFAGDGRKAFKVGHLLRLQGKKHEEVPQLIPGDFGALTKIEELDYGVVLHDSHDEDHIRLKPLNFPTPMQGLAIEASRRGDEQRLAEVLQRLQAEDPCVRLDYNASTQETVLRGMGELHLRYLLERMAGQYKLEVQTRTPSVPYRETATRAAEGHSRHKKQTGGAGQFGEVFLRVEPLPRGGGFEFVDAVKGGVIPGQFIPSVEKGVRSALSAGPLAGFPVADVKVTVFDGKSHSVDSKDIAFQAAGRKAMLDALRNAGGIVLEPVVSIEVTAPDTRLGDITADLTGRRGQVLGTESLSANVALIRGQVPLAELDGYANRLKSITAGQGLYDLSPSHYNAVPQDIQQRLASGYKAVPEDD